MSKEILCTYLFGGNYTFEWLEENEVEEWLEENKDRYEDIEIVRVKVIDKLYRKEL